MASKTNNNYSVSFKLELEFNLDLSAASLEDSVTKAKAFETIDLIRKIPEVLKDSGFSDYDHEVMGIYSNG